MNNIALFMCMYYVTESILYFIVYCQEKVFLSCETVIGMILLFERKYIIRCAVKNVTEFFNSENSDILIFSKLVKRVLVDARVDKSILRNPTLLHSIP